MNRPARDLWTLFPVAALLGFAGWVALMVETADVAAAILFVAAFLAAAWKAQRWYHEIRHDIAERRELRQRQEWMSE